MLAVRAYADGKGGCPFELMEALWIDIYHLQPAPGSLEDQDTVQLARYDQLRNIYRVCCTFNQGGLKALSSREFELVMEIAQMELDRDNAKL
jgi:hypothetical protein